VCDQFRQLLIVLAQIAWFDILVSLKCKLIQRIHKKKKWIRKKYVKSLCKNPDPLAGMDCAVCWFFSNVKWIEVLFYLMRWCVVSSILL